MHIVQRFLKRTLLLSVALTPCVASAQDFYRTDKPAADVATPSLATTDNLTAIQNLLNDLAKNFAKTVPEPTQLTSFFDTHFIHDGQSRSEYLEKVLCHVEPSEMGGFSYQGVSFSALRPEGSVNSDSLEVSFDVNFREGFRPERERLVVKRVGDRWLLVGNGLAARVRVNLMSRLGETPLSKARLAALPGVSSFEGSWEGPTYTYYQRTILDNAGDPFDLWLCRVGQECFGRMGWAGDEIGYDQRLARWQYTQYYAKPNSRVSNYIMFNVPVNRVDGRVAEINVSGPGLPAAGLTLEPPTRRERPYWVFKGDILDWNAFNTQRCNQIDNLSNPVPRCAMDWSAVSKGSLYTFTLKDAGGNVVATLTDELRSKPINETKAYAQRDALFPQFNLERSRAFSIKNIYNDTRGAFLPGKEVFLSWTPPTKPGLRMMGVSLAIQTAEIDVSLARIHKDYWQFKPLYVSDYDYVSSTSATFLPAHPINPNWAWATLSAVDNHGNLWEQEISPHNPR